MWNKKDFEGKRKAVISHFERVGFNQSTLSEYCTLAGLPVIVVCEFVMEEMPQHTDFCKEKIAQLKLFYNIK